MPDFSRVSEVDPLSGDEGPFYSASGESQIRATKTRKGSLLALSGMVIDTIENSAIGPTKDQRKVQNAVQRLALRIADKVHLSEILPSMAYKPLSGRYPKLKEVFDDIQTKFLTPEEFKEIEEHLQSVPEEGMMRFVEYSASSGALRRYIPEAKGYTLLRSREKRNTMTRGALMRLARCLYRCSED